MKDKMEEMNSKEISVMLREAGILFAITLIAGLVLGLIYELTKEPIRIQQERAIQEACSAVFQSASSFEKWEVTIPEDISGPGVKIGNIYKALGEDESMLGIVLESTSSEGYAGNIVLYMGVTMDGTLNDISLLEISETPGLGMLAEDILVPQFHNKNVEGFVYTKTGGAGDNEIDGISGDTKTTRAITNAVNGGLKAVQILLKGGVGNE